MDLKKISIVPLYLSLTMLSTISSEDPNKFLPCRLTWNYMGIGDPVPIQAVATQSGKVYIVRAPDSDGNLAIGSFSTVTRVASFPFENLEDNSTSSTLTSFEILTNTHKCIISWPQHLVGEPLPSFTILMDESQPGGPYPYIGRGFVDQEQGWLTGGVNPNTHKILIPTVEGSVIITEYQVLTSHSLGLQLTATNFIFTTDPFQGQISGLGEDYIVNNGDMGISKKTRHQKRFVESTSVTTTSSTTSTKTEKSGFDIGIVGSTRKVDHTYTESVTETIKTTRVTEIIVEKELIIPPFSTITACSTVTILDSFSSPFTARGVYSAAGMRIDEIFKLLEDEGIQGPTIVVGENGEEEVVVEIQGNFEGSLSMDSQFVAVEGNRSCMEVQMEIFKQRMAKIKQLY